MGDLNASNSGRRRMKCLEAHHWFCETFDEAVILFKDIVEIFDLPDFNDPSRSGEFQDRIDSLQTSQIGSALVDDNPLGNAVGCDGHPEKLAGCGQIPTFRQHEIKGLAIAVNRPIQVDPLATNLELGLVNTPGAGRMSFAHLCLCGNLRRVANNPSVQSRVINDYAAFSQKLLKVTIGNGIADVKEDCMQDDIFGKMSPFEIDRHSLHTLLDHA